MSLVKTIRYWEKLLELPYLSTFSSNTSLSSLVEGFKLASELPSASVLLPLFMSDTASYCRRYFRFDMETLLSDPDLVNSYVYSLKDIISVLDKEDLTSGLEQLAQHTKEALLNYDVASDKVESIVSNPRALAYIRRDAESFVASCEKTVFKKGSHGAQTPKYSQVIFQYHDWATMVSAVYSMSDGIHLVGVGDSQGFILKNGENLVYLSEGRPHGSYHTIDRDYFNNSSLTQDNIIYPALHYPRFNSYTPYVKDSAVTDALVPTSFSPAYVKPQCMLNEFKDVDLVWAVYVLEGLYEFYWDLDVTGEPTYILNRVLTRGDSTKLPSSLVPISSGQPMLDPLSPEDMNVDFLGVEVSSDTQWLVDTYSSLVNPDHVLNLCEDSEGLIPFIELPKRRGEPLLAYAYLNSRHFGMFDSYSRLHAIPYEGFQTKESLQAENLLNARYNYVLWLNSFAQSIFLRQVTYVRSDILSRIDKHFLKIVEKWVLGGCQDIASKSDPSRTLISLVPINRSTGMPVMVMSSDVKHSGQEMTHFSCYFTGVRKCSFELSILPRGWEDLAYLLDCSAQDLPSTLQTWSQTATQEDLRILNRGTQESLCSPKLLNPSELLAISISAVLSKKALKLLQKGIFEACGDGLLYSRFNTEDCEGRSHRIKVSKVFESSKRMLDTRIAELELESSAYSKILLESLKKIKEEL